MRKPSPSKPQKRKQLVRSLLINLALLVVAVILLFIGMSQFLKWYTNHGESLTVPDFRGMTIDEAIEQTAQRNLRYEVRDSVFADDKPKLSVLEQNPKAGSKVKAGRRIYFIINAEKAPKISLPDLENVTRRQAVKILESYGFREGKIEYKPDIALNAVLEMKYKGRVVKPGEMLDKGSTIDLVLGDGGRSPVKVEVPDLKGKTLDEAIFILRGSFINLGAAIYDDGVTDSSEAIIYRQRPLSDGRKISQGEAVDVWLNNGDIPATNEP